MFWSNLERKTEKQQKCVCFACTKFGQTHTCIAPTVWIISVYSIVASTPRARNQNVNRIVRISHIENSVRCTTTWRKIKTTKSLTVHRQRSQKEQKLFATNSKVFRKTHEQNQREKKNSKKRNANINESALCKRPRAPNSNTILHAMQTTCRRNNRKQITHY